MGEEALNPGPARIVSFLFCQWSRTLWACSSVLRQAALLHPKRRVCAVLRCASGLPQRAFLCNDLLAFVLTRRQCTFPRALRQILLLHVAAMLCVWFGVAFGPQLVPETAYAWLLLHYSVAFHKPPEFVTRPERTVPMVCMLTSTCCSAYWGLVGLHMHSVQK